MRSRFKGWTWFLLLPCLSTLGIACAQPPAASAPTTQSTQEAKRLQTAHKTERLQIIPWVEANFSKYDEQVIEGLLVWRGVTDKAIVSTMPGRAEEGLFRKLQERVPGLRIIPGLKTMELMRPFDSLSGWERVGREVRTIVRLTGETTILLENEKALEAYVDGREPIELEKLKRGLMQLPEGIQYLWYPSVFGLTPEIRGRNAAVCRVVQEGLADVRFLDQRFQGANAVKDRNRQAADRLLKSFAKSPTLPMQYFYGTSGRYVWWRDDQLREALELVQREWGEGADVVIYPGLRRWVTASRELSAELSKGGPIGPASVTESSSADR